MHLGVLLLAESTAHEKSKTAFYICGGVLAAWAVGVSFLSFSQADFPGSTQRTRGVIAISMTLVAATIAAALLTGSTPTPAPAYVKNVELQKGTSPAPTPTGGGVPSAASAPPARAHTGAPGNVAIAADPGGQLKFDQARLVARTGKVSVEFTNDYPVAHNLTIASASGVVGATPTFTGASKRLSVELKPGSYQYYCTVAGHRQAGMQGTLTVR
jgi:plastocyanin